MRTAQRNHGHTAYNNIDKFSLRVQRNAEPMLNNSSKGKHVNGISFTIYNKHSKVFMFKTFDPDIISFQNHISYISNLANLFYILKKKNHIQNEQRYA